MEVGKPHTSPTTPTGPHFVLRIDPDDLVAAAPGPAGGPPGTFRTPRGTPGAPPVRTHGRPSLGAIPSAAAARGKPPGSLHAPRAAPGEAKRCRPAKKEHPEPCDAVRALSRA
jgi:hypothetical protein